jgi:hypothetical protein
MRLVLAKGRSQYGSLRLHLDQLAAALTAMGHEVTVIDLLEAEGALPVVRAILTGADCFFAFNGMACETAAMEVVRRSGCVYASAYVDHPVHHLPRLTHDINKQVVFFLDRSHVQFMAAWGATRTYAHIGFLPPGANTLDEPVDTSDEAFARRDIPLLFTGTYRGPPQPAWTNWPESAAKDLVADTAQRMADDGRLPLLEALRAATVARKARLSAELLESICLLLSSAQQYAEAFHRQAVLTAFGEAGVPVEVHGIGWAPLCERYPSFRHAGEGSFQETLHLLRRARLVLNINNGFVAGGHERVFTAMSAGAAVFSESSRYYDDAFTEADAPARPGHGGEIATYSIRRPERAAGQLKALLADLPAQTAMARAGYERAKAEHGWTARAARMMKVIEAVR